MFKKFQNVLLPGLILLASGCAPKTHHVLTGDTAFEMQSSIVMVSQNLSSERRQEFDQAIETIILSSTDRRLSVNGDRLSAQAIKALKGRSVNQVIESAKLIRSVAASY